MRPHRRQALAGAVAMWTAAAFGFLLLDPGGDVLWRAFSTPPFTCGRLVGRSFACDTALQALDHTWHWLHTYPMLAFIALGYVAILAIAIRGRSRGTRRAGSLST